MNSLEIYFQNEYAKDLSELREVESILQKVLPTFVYAYVESENAWPYEIKNNDAPTCPPKYSTSTNSMIIAMMRLASGKSNQGIIFPDVETGNILEHIFNEGFSLEKYMFSDGGIEKEWSSIIAHGINKYKHFTKSNYKQGKITKSKTYGDNDPLSLLWYAEILDDGSNRADIAEKINNIQNISLDKVYTKDILDFGKNKNRPSLNVHSFVSLKLLQLLRMLNHGMPITDRVFDFFEKRLHLHLSYNDIPDSRFDPAELAFSLEGALRCGNGNSLADEAIERALCVLEKSQDLSPYWRPINPIYATKQGQILLPLSVEVANSLLRICAMLNIDNYKESPFSRHAGMFKRYFRWLKAQIRMISLPSLTAGLHSIECWGWESEHVGGEGEIHLFQTSEIACFLINYRHMLQDRIARQSLDVSGLKVDYSYVMSNNETATKDVVLKKWNEKISSREPLLELPSSSPYKIFQHIGDNFLAPRFESKSKPKFSMLLYGPPGTGKTSIAKGIAEALCWKCITVTPSDFLAGGSAEVEARAKAIFQCLEEQSNAVILFDEIDQFLLDRESKLYKGQSGIFQFMTPGMLPKLHGLRDKKRSIFIVATNYEERIDPAIKRLGRIDALYPLMPPAYKQRDNIVRRYFEKELRACGCTEEITSFVRELVEKTALCTYSDIKSLLDTHSKDKAVLLAVAHEYASIKPSQYTSRIEQKTDSDDSKTCPGVEYLLLGCIMHQDVSGHFFSLKSSFSSEFVTGENESVLSKVVDALTCQYTKNILKNIHVWK